MSRRHARAKIDEPGGDSFLDVVANLVGILIILVMVVGAGTRSAAMALAKHSSVATAPLTNEPELPDPTIEQRKHELVSAQKDNRVLQASFDDLENRIAEEAQALELREKERSQAQIVVTVAEQRLAQHRDELQGAEKEQYDLQADLAAAQRELERLDQARRVAGEKLPPEVLEHFPTPMARTVFGTELHFRLQGGRISFVPWDELVARLKADAPNKVQRLRSAERTEETLAPFGGYVLKYALRKTQSGGQTLVELERFVLLPTGQNPGEPLHEALANPHSELLSRLNELGPRKATLTVWTYPDSFEEFRQLKAEMYKRGYLTAARPLPNGMPIGGSPDGSRSSAE